MGYSHIVIGLTFLLKKNKVFKFNPIIKESFKYFKKYFIIKPILHKANSALFYILELDISFIIASNILSQKNPNTKELDSIIYYFKKFFLAKLNYII